MSDTPRSDAIADLNFDPKVGYGVAAIDLARDLERELYAEVAKRQQWAPAITKALHEAGIVTDTGDLEECVNGIHALADLRDTWHRKFFELKTSNFQQRSEP